MATIAHTCHALLGYSMSPISPAFIKSKIHHPNMGLLRPKSRTRGGVANKTTRLFITAITDKQENFNQDKVNCTVEYSQNTNRSWETNLRESPGKLSASVLSTKWAPFHLKVVLANPPLFCFLVSILGIFVTRTVASYIGKSRESEKVKGLEESQFRKQREDVPDLFGVRAFKLVRVPEKDVAVTSYLEDASNSVVYMADSNADSNQDKAEEPGLLSKEFQPWQSSAETQLANEKMGDLRELAAEEALTAVVEEKMAELEHLYRQEMEAVRDTAEAENCVMREQMYQKVELEAEVSTLKRHLNVVKELTQFLLEADMKEKGGKSSQFSEEEVEERQEDKVDLKMFWEENHGRIGELEDAMKEREAMVEALEEKLKVSELEREHLTVELRNALAECNTLSERCESLAEQLNEAKLEKDKSFSETDLAEARRQLKQDTLLLGEAEEVVARRMGELGEKEIEVEKMQREMRGLKKETEAIKMALKQRELDLFEAEAEFETQQFLAAEEIAWLRNTAGQVAILEEELNEAKAELKRYKKDVAAKQTVAEKFTFHFLDFMKAGEGMFNGAQSASDEKAKDSNGILRKPVSSLEEEKSMERERQLFRATASKLKWQLAGAIADQVREERFHYEEVEALKRQLAQVRGKSVDDRLRIAQEKIQELRERLVEQDTKMELYRKQANAALEMRDRQISLEKEKYKLDLQRMEEEIRARYFVDRSVFVREQSDAIESLYHVIDRPEKERLSIPSSDGKLERASA